MSRPVVIAYDGSEDASAAVREAGRLFPGQPAVVLTVWESVAGLAGGARAALPAAVVAEALVALDQSAQEEAEKTAADGARIAGDAGLDATSFAAKAAHNVWSTILSEAEGRDAGVVVVGSRGRSPVRAAVLGSVSNSITANSRLPVLVVRAG
jgi:nucleotide-binding universal stress UspA family protein